MCHWAEPERIFAHEGAVDILTSGKREGDRSIVKSNSPRRELTGVSEKFGQKI